MRLINADALKRKVQRLATQEWKMKVKASVETILNQFIDDIDHAPTIDAVPVVHGHWNAATYWYCCSNCTAHYRARYAYCPSCGAVMDGKDGEDA